MYSSVTRMLLVCTRTLLLYSRMSLVCTGMYLYVTRMFLVCYSCALACYSYALVWCFSHHRQSSYYSCQAFGRTSNKMGSLFFLFFFLFFFNVASVTFHQGIAGSIIQDGRRLRSGRQAICIIYIIISLRKCMVYLRFILLRIVLFPNTIFRLIA